MSLALIDAQRRDQARTATAVATLVSALWDETIDPMRLDATFPLFAEAATGAVVAGRARAADSAGTFYLAHRRASGITDPVAIAYASAPNLAATRTSLAVTGPVRVKKAIGSGVQVAQATRLGQSGAARAAYRITADGGRDTIARTIQRDTRARGWARVSDGKPCAFCAMLLSRGAIYKDANGLLSKKDERYHDGCGCTLQPVYGSEAELPTVSSRAEEVWQEATADKSGRDALNAFRSAWNAST